MPAFYRPPYLLTLPAELLTLIIVQLPWPSQHALGVAFPTLSPHLASGAARKTRYLDESYELMLEDRLRASWMQSFGKLAMRPERGVAIPKIPAVILEGYFVYLETGEVDALGEYNRYGRWTQEQKVGNVFLMQQGEKNWGMTTSPILQDPLLLPVFGASPEERELKLVVFAFGEVILMWSWNDASQDTVENLMLEVGKRFLKRWREIDFCAEMAEGVVFQTQVAEGGMLTMDVWAMDDWLRERVDTNMTGKGNEYQTRRPEVKRVTEIKI